MVPSNGNRDGKRLRLLLRVLTSAHHVKRHIGLVSDNPTVVRIGRDVEHLARTQFEHTAVLERRRADPAQDIAKMLDRAITLSLRHADMLRPAPARLIRRAPD